MPGLREQAQNDFSVGAFQGIARDLIPEHGLYAAVNTLLDNDGLAYKRGGSALLSTGPLNAAGLQFVLDAYLAAGQRTLFADAADFGVLDATEGPLNLGGAGVPGPKRAAIIAGVAVVGGGTMYAGSRKTANYTTGTISTTQGSKVVSGSGTTWNTLVDAGMFLKIGAERYYVVASVDSVTQITLAEPYEGSTGSGKAYTLSPLATCPRTSDFYASGFNRLISIEGDEIRFSRQLSAGQTGLPPVGNTQWQTFDPTDVHKLPGGVQGTGAYFLGDTLYVFTTGGVYAVANMAYDLTDDSGNLQQPLTRVAPDLTLWANEGIASFGDSIVIPATDGVWMLGPNGIEKLSRSIDGRYIPYVRSGYKPGGAAVYRNYYLLPILTNAGAIVEVLACRLDRPTRTRIGTVYPWSWLTGSGASVACFAVRTGSTQRQPKLLAAGLQTSARVLDCSGYFEPTATVKQDHDGTNFEWDMTTRDFIPDRLNVKALVKRLRLRYEMIDAANDDPSIAAWYSIGVLQPGVSLWDSMNWGDNWAQPGDGTDIQLSGQAGEDDGRVPYTWLVNKRVRFIRFRFRSFKPVAKLVIRNLEVFSRPTGRQ